MNHEYMKSKQKMSFDPIDPQEFYAREAVRGRTRLNIRAIANSPNVVEFQSYTVQYNFETYGKDTAIKVYEHYLEKGYRKS